MYRSKAIEQKGKCVVEAILEGKIGNFEVYVYNTLGESQKMESRSNQIGSSVVRYLQTFEDENFVEKVLKMILEIDEYNFIEIFRVAQDLSTKLATYLGNRRMKTSYLRRHPDLSEYAYDMSLWMAKYLKK